VTAKPRISASKLHQAREAKQLRQHELAVLVGVSPSSIYRYERSDLEASRISAVTLAAIAAKLGHPVTHFYADDMVAA
jgi:transcriptional regulator with XRE-family HTH domain